MNIKQLITEKRAVSPVIGVILMVAITVILAAVIGTFVLGLGDQVSESAPQAQFTFETGSSTQVNITHDGGDAIEAANLNISSGVPIGIYDGSIYSDGDSPADAVASGDSTSANLADTNAFTNTDSVSAGTQILVGTSGSFTDETVRVIWSSPNSDKTATIGQFEV